jgi:serine/threonine protein kinase
VLKKAQVVKMKQVEHTNDERRMLQQVKHPFLITLWGTFQDSKNLYMVMDFVEGGELFSLLRKSQVCHIRALHVSVDINLSSASPTPSPSSMLQRLRSHSTTCTRITSSTAT